MPTKLRKRAISIAHEGHQSIIKTEQLLREKIWFPGMDEEVKKMIGECLARQANGPDPHPDPLHMSPLPPEPWYTVHVDFCGPFPTGEYLLVVIDAYSRFPEVDIVRIFNFCKVHHQQAGKNLCCTWNTEKIEK